MSLEQTTTDPIHIPARRDVFVFDEEVSSIFDNMAPRSIPMYNEVHRLHVSLLRPWLRPGALVVDVGSSTGCLFRTIEKEFCKRFHETGIRGVAIDGSPGMMNRLRSRFQSVDTYIAHIPTFSLDQKADVMFVLYLLQFVPPGQKEAAYDWIVENTKPGGVIVLGQKESVHEDHDLLCRWSAEYYRFRKDNGYSQEEIDAKTAALKNSMWPVSAYELTEAFVQRGVEVQETTRWLQFSTSVGIRRM